MWGHPRVKPPVRRKIRGMATRFGLTIRLARASLGAMVNNSALVFIACSVLALGGCGSIGDVFSEDTAMDTIGMPRSEPGHIVIDDGDATVPTPYGGAGARLTCETVARDIARLTALLGPDLEPEDAHAEQENEQGRLQQARNFASDLVDDAPDVAEGAARSAIVGLNPVRPIVRFIGQAGEIEAAARREQEIALKRRAWLRGAFDVQSCDPAILLSTLEAYNLITRSDEAPDEAP